MIKKITALSMALLLPALASAYTPKKEALLVGVEHYKNGEYLYGVGKDIQRMKKLLEKRGFHVRILFDEQATKANVINALKSYRYLHSDDTFVFYDSSHGTQVLDQNGDEADGLDEAYVLYDINENISNEEGLLIDDQLDNLLSTIVAKKVVIADSCHSGTMYKSFSRNAKTKSVRVASNFKFRNKGLVTGVVQKPKNLIAFGAAGDNQLSIATDEGSLFTEAFVDTLETKPNITFREMQYDTAAYIKDACSHSSDLRAYTPTLYSTNNNFLNKPIDEFINVNIHINPKKVLVEEYLDQLMANGQVGRLNLSSKNFYNKGAYINLGINTLGQEGHLYILTSKESENEISVLYPNPHYKNRNKLWRGAFNFPSVNAPFRFKATNNTRGLERTVVYTILSQTIIPELEVSRVGYNKFQSIFKDFNGQSSLKNTFKDIIIKRKDNQLSMAKTVFSVGI